MDRIGTKYWFEKENERRQKTREEIKTEIDEIMLASLQSDNRNFIQISIARQIYRALLDPVRLHRSQDRS